jgi:hypothetical protein
MRRFLVLCTLLTLAGAACSEKSDEAKTDIDDGNLGTIETAVEEGSPGIEPGDRLIDAAVATDGVLYLALRDKEGHHRLLSLRQGREPREVANEETVPGFAPTAVAVDSRLRVIYVASGDELLKFEDSHGAVGNESLLAKRGPPEPARVESPYASAAEIGVPRYMAFDARTKSLYFADLCQVMRYVHLYGTAKVVRVADGPGADCSDSPDLITGLAVDQRTGDVYVGRGNALRRVGADGKLAPVAAKGEQDDAPKPVEGLLSGRSLAVNGVGDVLVATSSAVLRVRPDGTLDRVRGVDEGPNISHSGYPDDKFQTVDNEDWIGFDGAGNLYAATRSLPGRETDNPVRIRRVTAGAL